MAVVAVAIADVAGFACGVISDDGDDDGVNHGNGDYGEDDGDLIGCDYCWL